MSKKILFALGCLAIPAFIYYTAAEGSWFGDVTMSEYMLSYFEIGRYYFLLYTIFTLPFLLWIDTPILEPIFYIRLKDNALYYILKRGVIMSALLSVYIFFAFVISGLIFGYENDMKISWLKYICVLFTYILSIYIVNYVVYIITDKPVVGKLSIFFNYFIVAFVYALDLLDLIKTEITNVLNIALEVYIILSLSVGIFYIYKKLKTKECLKLKST